MSGQTIEMLNTDAEGRLILCDALTYARALQAGRRSIDIATLTGACVIALGHHNTGLFSQGRRARAASCSTLGDEACDPAWRLPLDDEYQEQLKSNFADVANIGGRPAGSDHGGVLPVALHAKLSVGAPRHRRHRLEERRGEGRDRPSGAAARAVPDRPGRGRSRRAMTHRSNVARVARVRGFAPGVRRSCR